MKKFVFLIVAVGMVLGLLGGCGRAAGGNETLSIVTTVFPAYDWVLQLLGDRADQVRVSLLLDGGADMHSYQPTAGDMITLSGCDLFIHVGGSSDGWVDDALKNAANEDMIVVDLLQVLGDAALEEEYIEGMEEEDHDHDEAALDEHVWLSLGNAQTFCSHIAGQLARLDPENAETYSANAQSYCTRLEALDARYEETVEAAAFDTLLVADRFPFRYLVQDYGLKYCAAFSGCSAETEASFETIVFLADRLDELGLKTVLITESANGQLANTVIEATVAKDQRVLTLNAMQGTTSKDAAQGVTYFSVMESNLEVLQQALN